MANTYNQLLTRGTASDLENCAISDGKIRLATDTEQLYIDLNVSSSRKRIAISDFVIGYTSNQIKTLASPLSNKFYLASDTNALLYFENGEWKSVSMIGGILETKHDDFTLTTIWEDNEDPATQTVFPYKQFIPTAKYNDNSTFNAQLLAANPSDQLSITDERNISYIRKYIVYSTLGILVLASKPTEVNLTLRVFQDPVLTDIGLEDISKAGVLNTFVVTPDLWKENTSSAEYPFEATVETSLYSDSFIAQYVDMIPANGSAFFSEEETAAKSKLNQGVAFTSTGFTIFATEAITCDLAFRICGIA